MTEHKSKRIELSEDKDAILHTNGVVIRKTSGYCCNIGLDYEDLAEILRKAYLPSAVPEELDG